jgi:hypothetical protein
MKILIFNLNTLYHLVSSTSIMKSYDADISWVVLKNSYKDIFKYNKNVDKIYTLEEVILNNNEKYDLIINLDAFINVSEFESLVSDKFIGFNFGANEKYREILSGNIKSKKNIFQIYYSIIDKKWKGEGYDIKYHPKNTEENDTSGIFLSNKKLDKIIKDNLSDNGIKYNNIYFSENNIINTINNINKYNNIITDDLNIYSISNVLRKNIYFMDTGLSNCRIELFGKGKIFKIKIGDTLWF